MYEKVVDMALMVVAVFAVACILKWVGFFDLGPITIQDARVATGR